jgi:uncharacterized protein (DUF2267 family)
VTYEAFIERVAGLAGLSEEDAAETARAVLRTLGERIGRKEARDTASQLPKELQGALVTNTRREDFGSEEFVRRVAERLGIDPEEARKRARAVFLTLHEAVSHGELEDWEAYLPPDYVDLAARHAELGGAPRGGEPGMPGHDVPLVGAGQFLQLVAERAGIEEAQARRAVDAVLETFGERIAAGEAADLARQLPGEIAEPLLRPDGDPQRMSLDEFIERTAEREGVPPSVAAEHARAVLTTLRESVTWDEWRDTLSELPREFQDFLDAVFAR